MHAVIKQTMAPPIAARNTSLVMAALFSGTKALNPEIIIPTDPGLANPQMANVAIVLDFGCQQKKQ